jgi:hypothetical protein
MKAVSTIDHAGKTARIEITLERIEDGGDAVNVVTSVAEALWPEIEFVDLPGDPESQNSGPASEPAAEAEAPAPAVKKARRAIDWSQPPKPGSVTERVLEASRRMGTSDFNALADELDLMTHVAAGAVAKLRKGGFIA